MKSTKGLEVVIAPRVHESLRRMSPETRHRVRLAIANLAHERGDTKPLDGELAGFFRLRVGAYRVIYWYQVVKSRRHIMCEFVEQRSLVYEMIENMIREGTVDGSE